jgi:L-rhamnose-H+ transport protein
MLRPLVGIGLLVTASAVNASFGVLMKLNRRWAWENTWLVWGVFALVLFPFLLTQATVADIPVIYGNHGSVVLRLVLLGLVWGSSQIFFGLAMETAGIAVSFATILGISAVLGGLIPFLHSTGTLLSATGILLMAGVVIMLVGIGFCAWAGRLRDAALRPGTVVSIRGLVYCIVAGMGSGLMNIALVFGAPLSAAAVLSGASTTWAQNVVWLAFLASGAIPNILYCLWLLRRNRSVARYFVRCPKNLDAGHRHWVGGASQSWLLATAMAVCWLGSVVLYGAATTQMGAWGAVLAWPVYMSLIVISGTVTGVLMGEWSLPSPAPIRYMTKGIVFLVLAVFLIAGSGMQT